MIAEFRIYLEQNFCLSKIWKKLEKLRSCVSWVHIPKFHLQHFGEEKTLTNFLLFVFMFLQRIGCNCSGGGEWEDCKALVEEHFAAMHVMAMEKFFIPVEICNQVADDQVKDPPAPNKRNMHLLILQDFLELILATAGTCLRRKPHLPTQAHGKSLDLKIA